MKKFLPVALFCLIFAFVSTVALAQGRPAGIRITVTNVDANSGQVDFDVTLNTSRVYGSPTIASPTGLLGSYIFTTFYAASYPPGYTGQLLSPVIPAIDFGDGSSLGVTQIPQVAPGSYRGSFSHTYPGPGTYDLRASAAAMMGLGTGNGFTTVQAEITTGNVISNPGQTPTTPAGTMSFLGSWVGRSFFGGATTYNLVGPLGAVFPWGVSNSVTSGSPYGAGGGGLLIAAGPVTDIPTASDFGLALFALLLAGAGAYTLIRR